MDKIQILAFLDAVAKAPASHGVVDAVAEPAVKKAVAQITELW
jgi:hypothetical protein